MRDINASPINPLPPVVWGLVAAVGVPELYLLAAENGLAGAAGIGRRVEAIQRFGFSGQIFDWMVASRYFPAEHLIRFVTYPFVQASFTQGLFVVVFILALGKMVGEVFRPLALLAVFFGAAIAGALAYALLLNDSAWLVGGFPAVYGLIGAFTWLIWSRLGQTGGNRLHAFTLIATLLGIQLIFGLIFGGNREWVADLAGFGAGFGISILVGPGGWRQAVARIRRR